MSMALAMLRGEFQLPRCKEALRITRSGPDSKRTEIVGIECSMVNMIRRAGLKWFMTLWYTKCGMGRVAFRKQSIEEAVEFALANVTDVTDFNGMAMFAWAWVWLPQSVAESRMCDRHLNAKSVIVCH